LADYFKEEQIGSAISNSSITVARILLVTKAFVSSIATATTTASGTKDFGFK